MGNAGAKEYGLESAPVTLENSVKGVLKRVDEATREKTSGTFQDFENEQAWPW